MTQPRRLAALSLADRVAKYVKGGSEVGKYVGEDAFYSSIRFIEWWKWKMKMKNEGETLMTLKQSIDDILKH